MNRRRLQKLAGLLTETISEAVPPTSVKNDPKKMMDVQNLIKSHEESKKDLMSQIESIKTQLEQNDKSLEVELKKVLSVGKLDVDRGIWYKTPGSTEGEISSLQSVFGVKTDPVTGNTNVQVSVARFHPKGDYSTPPARARAQKQFFSDLNRLYRDVFKK